MTEVGVGQGQRAGVWGKDKPGDVQVLSAETAFSVEYRRYQHGAHAVLFARDQSVIWNLYPTKAAILVRLFTWVRS